MKKRSVVTILKIACRLEETKNLVMDMIVAQSMVDTTKADQTPGKLRILMLLTVLEATKTPWKV